MIHDDLLPFNDDFPLLFLTLPEDPDFSDVFSAARPDLRAAGEAAQGHCGHRHLARHRQQPLRRAAARPQRRPLAGRHPRPEGHGPKHAVGADESATKTGDWVAGHQGGIGGAMVNLVLILEDPRV